MIFYFQLSHKIFNSTFGLGGWWSATYLRYKLQIKSWVGHETALFTSYFLLFTWGLLCGLESGILAIEFTFFIQKIDLKDNRWCLEPKFGLWVAQFTFFTWGSLWSRETGLIRLILYFYQRLCFEVHYLGFWCLICSFYLLPNPNLKTVHISL